MTTGNESSDTRRKGIKSGDGRFRNCSQGIFIKSDTFKCSDRLEACFQRFEGFYGRSNLPAIQAKHFADYHGGHNIVKIEFSFERRILDVDQSALETIGYFTGRCKMDRFFGQGKITVVDIVVFLSLKTADILLGGDILVEGLVIVQVIRNNILHDGDMRRAGNIHQLVGGQFHDHQRTGGNLVQKIQGWGADISYQNRRDAGLGKDVMDKRSGGGFAFGAGDANDFTEAGFQKYLGMGSKNDSGLFSGDDFRIVRGDTRRFNDHLAFGI